MISDVTAVLMRDFSANMHETGGVVAGALPLLYGMAEGIVTGVTPRPEAPAVPEPARPAFGDAPLAAARRGWLPAGLAGNGPGPRRARRVLGQAGEDDVVPPIHSSFHAWSYCWSLHRGW